MNLCEIQKIFQIVQKKVRCPHCGKKYSFENIHIQSTTGSVCFLRLECENHMPMLASIAINGPKIEIETNREQITTDDVIDAHEKISKIKNIDQLFK